MRECRNKRIEKSYDAVFLGMISKIKTATHTSELQYGLSNPKVSWEKKETKEDKRQIDFPLV